MLKAESLMLKAEGLKLKASIKFQMTKNKFQTKADSAFAHNFMQSILPQGTQKKFRKCRK